MTTAKARNAAATLSSSSRRAACASSTWATSGHRLTQAQIDAIGPVDVLLVPVGGFFTIDASGATEVMEQLQPRVTIPMHYKTKDVTIRQLKPAQPFLAGKQVEEKNWGVTLYADRLPEYGSGVVWVLEPKAAQE